MKLRFMKLALAAFACLAAAQLVRPETSNPPLDPARSFFNDRAIDPRVAGVIRRACADCHSHETKWPWYARISPFSWLMDKHVREGRAKLNLSDWSGSDPDQVQEIFDSIAKQKMPMWSYLLMHPTARLTPADRSLLQSWVDAKLAQAGGRCGWCSNNRTPARSSPRIIRRQRLSMRNGSSPIRMLVLSPIVRGS